MNHSSRGSTEENSMVALEYSYAVQQSEKTIDCWCVDGMSG